MPENPREYLPGAKSENRVYPQIIVFKLCSPLDNNFMILCSPFSDFVSKVQGDLGGTNEDDK